MNFFMELENNEIDFNVEYRRRKTLSIRIDPTGKILVIAPKGLPEEAIKGAVESKSKWIIKKLQDLKEIDYRPYDRKFIDGEFFMFLGERIPLKIVIDKGINKPIIEVVDGELNITTFEKEPEFLETILKKWYKEQCFIMIVERVDYYKEILGKEPRKIKVKEQKRRWGTCTSRGDILLNWRCIMAPLDIIDYIVVHEMCHLIHMNHSKDFWRLVESILPDYKERKVWLKKYGLTLDM